MEVAFLRLSSISLISKTESVKVFELKIYKNNYCNQNNKDRLVFESED